jgi:hypothetical protein
MKFDDFLVEYELTDRIDTETLLKCEFTSRNISDLFSIKLLTVKRYAREFFTKDKDPIEIQKEGIARTFSFDEVFTFYLIYRLIDFEKFTIFETKKNIEKIKSWLLENGFYPSSYHKRDAKILNCIVFFSNYSFFVKKTLSKEPIEIDNKLIINEKYQIERCFIQDEKQTYYNIDFYDYTWKRIPIFSIKKTFLFKILAQTGKKFMIAKDEIFNLNFKVKNM